METEPSLRRMCRHCGALLKDASGQCWYCHRTLNYDDIIRVERRPPAQGDRGDLAGQSMRGPATRTQERLTAAARRPSVGSSIPWDVVYHMGGWITGAVVFVGCWIYAVVTYGLFLGLGLGWVPSLVIALIAGLLWPLIAVLIAVIAAVMIYAASR